jgi:hypothetical protein
MQNDEESKRLEFAVNVVVQAITPLWKDIKQ